MRMGRKVGFLPFTAVAASWRTSVSCGLSRPLNHCYTDVQRLRHLRSSFFRLFLVSLPEAINSVDGSAGSVLSMAAASPLRAESSFETKSVRFPPLLFLVFPASCSLPLRPIDLLQPVQITVVWKLGDVSDVIAPAAAPSNLLVRLLLLFPSILLRRPAL